MESDHQPLKVTFFPPLHHQRRIWILDTLRRERLTEIVDLGCGEGALLATLCQPAPWLTLRPNQSGDDDGGLSSLLCDVNLNDEETPDLHAMRVVGLDISIPALEFAAQCTSPASVNPLYTRWEPLEVELWQGSVDVINPAFINVQCIVASELIEHLTDDILIRVAPIVLGVYRPRVFLVTTPSYSFNQRWSPPGHTDSQGFPDPTGRTDRVFRHSDHKFEWTVDEFALWCNTVARQWGYRVETTTIGVPKEQDPWGRDEVLGGATQIACFRRIDDRLSRTSRERGTQDIRSATGEPHALVARHRHEAHPRAGCPSGLQEIEEAMIVKFQRWRETTLGVHELWFADDLPVLCGGSIEAMLDVVERSSRLELQRVAGQPRSNWKIQTIGGFTHQFPIQITPLKTENIMYEDNGQDCDVEESPLDSSVLMGMTCDSTAWCSEGVDWTRAGGGGDSWTTSWTN